MELGSPLHNILCFYFVLAQVEWWDKHPLAKEREREQRIARRLEDWDQNQIIHAFAIEQRFPR